MLQPSIVTSYWSTTFFNLCGSVHLWWESRTGQGSPCHSTTPCQRKPMKRCTSDMPGTRNKVFWTFKLTVFPKINAGSKINAPRRVLMKKINAGSKINAGRLLENFPGVGLKLKSGHDVSEVIILSSFLVYYWTFLAQKRLRKKEIRYVVGDLSIVAISGYTQGRLYGYTRHHS